MNMQDKNYTVEKIRESYTKREPSELDELKRLDKKVKRPANIFAYTIGTLSALTLGAGMSLIMTDIAQVVGISSPFSLGIIVGIIGLVAALINYPIHKTILNSRRRIYAKEIIELSNKISDS